MRQTSGFLTALALSTTLANAQLAPPVGPQGAPGGGGGGGTVTSVATSCGATGGPITSSGTISAAEPLNAQVGTSYTLQTTDCGKLLTFTNAGAISISLSSTNFSSGNFVKVRVLSGSAAATLTPSSGTIDGAASLVLNANQSTSVAFDGTNWWSTGRGVNGPASAVAGNIAGLSGTSGQLISDSGYELAGSQASGAPSSLQAHIGYYTGNNEWYPLIRATGATGSATTANVVTCTPIEIPSQGVTLKALGVDSTANVTSTFGSAALYYPDGAGHRPGTLIDATPAWTYSGSSAGFSAALNNTTDTLKSGAYWFCEYNSATPTLQSFSSAGSSAAWHIGSTNLANVTGNAQIEGLSCTAGTSCGSTSAWSGSTPSWGSMSAATWTNVIGSSTAPIPAGQVN